MLWSVILHARFWRASSIIKSRSSFRCFTNFCKKKEKDMWKKIITDYNTFNLNDNILLLVTTAVDPSYWLYVLSSLLKEADANGGQKVHLAWGSWTWWQSSSSAIKEFKNAILNFFWFKNFLSLCFFETVEKATSEKNEQQDLTNEKLVAEVNGCLFKGKLNTQTKEADDLLQWNKKIKIPASRQLCKETPFRTSIFCAIWMIIFWKTRNRLLPKTSFYFLTTTCESHNNFFSSIETYGC